MTGRRHTVLLAVLAGLAPGHASDPSISRVRVPQDSIVVRDGRCEGVIEFEATDPDNDTLLASIGISADSGSSWTVPLSSDFFFACLPGSHRVRFSTPGQYGAACVARVTVYDSLPTRGTMRFIPAAGHAYLMGSDAGRRDEAPRHAVILGRDFWIDTTEITEASFRQFRPNYRPEYLGLYFYDVNKPVDNCFWHWAVRYCNWRSAAEGLQACYTGLPDTGNPENYRNYFAVQCDPSKNGYRLPSEAEWEYACRAGSTAAWFWGSDSLAAGAYAWYRGNFRDTIHAVALKRPNRFGLYDMGGGMLELCNDWYDSTYYRRAPLLDPRGPASPGSGDDPFRVVRGGFFQSATKDMTSSSRFGNFSSSRHPQTFRCVRTALD